MEFSDDRRTLALPMRAALPVLTRALDVRARGAPERRAAGRGRAARACSWWRRASSSRPAAQPHWRATLLDADDTDRITRLAGSRHAATLDAEAAEQLVRQVLESVVDAMPRSAPPGRPVDAVLDGSTDRRRCRHAFTERLQARVARQRRRAEATCRSWCGSRCGSRPTRRSWSRAPYGSCCRCTTSRTRSTSARPRCSGPTAEPTTGSATAPAPTRASRCAARPRPGRCSTGCSSCGCPTRSRSTVEELASLLEDGVGALQARGVDVLWPRSLGRDLTATTVLDADGGGRSPSGADARGAAPGAAARRRHALHLPLAARPARRPAHAGGDGRAGAGRLAGPQAARQLDRGRPGDGAQGAASG